MYFSIIVPIYNAEGTLPEVLPAISAQTFGDFELILVNDGSSDDSLSICSTHAKTDSRVCVINQLNKGVASARNTGIEISSGTYVIFWDADDLPEKGALQRIYEATHTSEPDLLVFGYKMQFMHEKVVARVNDYAGRNITAVGHRELIRAYRALSSLCLMAAPWNKAFKRLVITQNRLLFTASISYGEDVDFVLRFLSKSMTMSAISDRLYNFRKTRSESLSSRYVANHELVTETLTQSFRHFFSKAEDDYRHEAEGYLNSFIVACHWISFMQYVHEKSPLGYHEKFEATRRTLKTCPKSNIRLAQKPYFFELVQKWLVMSRSAIAILTFALLWKSAQEVKHKNTH